MCDVTLEVCQAMFDFKMIFQVFEIPNKYKILKGLFFINCMVNNSLLFSIFNPGLYPLLAHAAINVRPILLTLYEVHLVPIAEYMKPGLSGFLNGVLPGLEEGADHYGRTSALLDKICAGVGSGVFHGCLWKCIAENGQIRLPAFTYILAHLDRKRLIEDQVEILGLNIDLMVRSLCASLEDNSVLVQRSALEFLLAAFPLHGTQLILQTDVVQLLAAAITALLRRDMSLNRYHY